MAQIAHESIQYATLTDGIVIIRVTGKGNHLNSLSLRHVFDLTKERSPAPRYVVDLDQCETLDSTFMGTLASMALHQRKQTLAPVVVTNIKPHVRNLLETLGLKYILDLRPSPSGLPEQPDPAAFVPADPPELSKMDRILMMIEAHERLVDADNDNEIKFEGVLKSLRESLSRENQ